MVGLGKRPDGCYNCPTLFSSNRVPVLLVCAISVCLLLVPGLSCIVYESSPMAGHAWPKTEYESRSFVTPECPVITEHLRRILGDPPYEPTTDGFDRVRNWVAQNVYYQTDEDRVGKDDEWQTPRDTLQDPRVGDCEDFSLLLCSLLRAYGIDAGHVFVAIGVDRRNDAHAFLIEDWYLDGVWRTIEPQAASWSRDGLFRLRSADSLLSRYQIVAAFNDVHYYEGDFPWDQERTNSLTLRRVAETTENVARRISEYLDYLLRSLSRDD